MLRGESVLQLSAPSEKTPPPTVYLLAQQARPGELSNEDP